MSSSRAKMLRAEILLSQIGVLVRPPGVFVRYLMPWKLRQNPQLIESLFKQVAAIVDFDAEFTQLRARAAFLNCLWCQRQGFLSSARDQIRKALTFEPMNQEYQRLAAEIESRIDRIMPDRGPIIPIGPKPPSRPPTTPIKEGVMSVAIQQTQDSVWVWIDLSEEKKHVLSVNGALESPVDEINLDMSDDLRRAMRTLDKIQSSPFYSEHDKEDERREITEIYTQPQIIRLNNLLANPYRYPITSADEGFTIVARLKKVVLPKVKDIIEASSRPSESFEI